MLLSWLFILHAHAGSVFEGRIVGVADGDTITMMEARHQNESSRVLARWTRYELIVVDEIAYVAMPETAGALLCQVIAERAERAARFAIRMGSGFDWNT